ncbi:MAG: hypothetical protein HQK54_16405 [Oligoflexales bacterium]|nr:hypothetical protein [Oligoflexales bacterium]
MPLYYPDISSRLGNLLIATSNFQLLRPIARIHVKGIYRNTLDSGSLQQFFLTFARVPGGRGASRVSEKLKQSWDKVVTY